MTKKTEKQIDNEKINKILNEAIDKKLEKLKEYRATPTKTHLDEKIAKLQLSDNTAVLLVTYDPDSQSMQLYGIKAKTSDMVAMSQYAYIKTIQNDIAGVLDCVSTVARQEELNDCWCKYEEKAEEIKEEEDAEDGK